jgi:hypothetical protein
MFSGVEKKFIVAQLNGLDKAREEFLTLPPAASCE